MCADRVAGLTRLAPIRRQVKPSRNRCNGGRYSRSANSSPGDFGRRPLPGHPAGGAAKKSRSFRQHVRARKRATAVVVRSESLAAADIFGAFLDGALVGVAGYCRAGKFEAGAQGAALGHVCPSRCAKYGSWKKTCRGCARPCARARGDGAIDCGERERSGAPALSRAWALSNTAMKSEPSSRTGDIMTRFSWSTSSTKA